MNPNPQATAARGERPQLFGTPSRGKGHADFGPSILATIDAGSSRSTRKHAGSSGRRIGLIGLFLLLAAGAYVAMRFSLAPAPVRVAAIPAAVLAPGARPTAVVAPVPAASQGAASIETVPAPVAQPASAALAVVASASAADAPASAAATSVAASVDNIRETLARSEPAAKTRETLAKTPESPVRPAAPRSTQVARVEPVKLRGSTAGTKSSSRSERDEDAALLAAMLPHLRSTIEGPTSPAFEKRCGALNGDALSECRIKFCNGRQGDDGACPTTGAGGR